MLQILHWTYVLIYQIKKSLKSNMWRRKRERVSTDQCWWACSWRPRIELLPSSLTRYTQCTSEMNEWDSLDGLVFIKWPMLKIVHLCLVWPLDLLGSLFSLNHWKFKLGAFLSRVSVWYSCFADICPDAVTVSLWICIWIEKSLGAGDLQISNRNIN